MKRLLFILLFPLLGTSQTQFDYLPGGGMPIVMSSSVEACFFFNFDGDPTGTNELKIVHGLNAGCYLASTTRTPINAPTHILEMNGTEFWSDCDGSFNRRWNSDTAWIKRNGVSLSPGSHVLPFTSGNNFGYFSL